MHPYFYKSVVAIFLLGLILQSYKAQAQFRDTVYADTVKVDVKNLPKHSPTKASIMSALLPGLGQAYNKKYWKIPIVYAGIAIPLYYGLKQNDLFTEKRDAYRGRISGDSTDKYLQPGNYFSNEGLLESMDINRRNRDLMFIISGTIYILQIVDASVDAHLFYFNVSDDLSLNYTPIFYYSQTLKKPVQGISLSLYF